MDIFWVKEKETMKKKVVIGISGGVDSAVATYLLMQKQYEVYAVNFIFHKNSSFCESKKGAIKVCDELKIPLIIKDYSDDFKKKVIDYFLDTYMDAKTPSPCIVCDEKMKMQKLFDISEELGAQYIASGHYVDTIYSDKYKDYFLKKAKDKNKDQTYMLYRLESNIIKKLIFPLNGYKKSEIRQIALKKNLSVSQKKDSQGICFAENGYTEFLKRMLGTRIQKGDFIDEYGNKIGEHNGYQLYTIGQRRGLGLNHGKPYFVIDILKDKNLIILGEFKKLFRKKVKIEAPKLYIPIEDCENIIAKPRFSSKGHNARLYYRENALELEYDQENAENSRGQHVVFYKNDMVVGGGIINFI